jgi:hypothetical protein
MTIVWLQFPANEVLIPLTELGPEITEFRHNFFAQLCLTTVRIYGFYKHALTVVKLLRYQY